MQERLLYSHLYGLWDGSCAVGCDLRLGSAETSAYYPFVHRTEGTRAGSDDLQRAFTEIDGLAKSQGVIAPEDYLKHSAWLLPFEALLPIQIQSLITVHLDLSAVYAGYSQFPVPVQAALIDLNLHYGIEGCLNWNEDLLDAVEAHHWGDCAQMCVRETVGHVRNQLLIDLFSSQSTGFDGDANVESNRSTVASPPPELSEEVIVEVSDSDEQEPVSTGQLQQEPTGGGETDGWKQELIEELKHSEGCIDHLYCDTVGYVTVGVGCMLPNAGAAMQLPLRYRDNNELASDEDKEDAFFEVQGAFTDNARASYYREYSNLYLEDSAIEAELRTKVEGFIDQLREAFDEFDSYPDTAKMAILDMAYNLGVSGIVNKFPTFTRAVRAQDWAACAQECRRKQIAQSRNDWVKQLFLDS